jgi:hypothetical protein
MANVIQLSKLSVEETVGLMPWFVNHAKDKTIDKVCRAGHAHFWAEKVHAALDLNEFKDDRPTSWCALGRAIGRNPEGFTSYANCHKSLVKDQIPRLPETLLRHAAAWAIGLDDSELSPTTEEWIARATRFLILKFQPDCLSALTPECLGLYAACMARSGPSGCPWADLRLFGEIARDFHVAEGAGAVKAAVLKTASIVGAILINKLGWRPDHG